MWNTSGSGLPLGNKKKLLKKFTYRTTKENIKRNSLDFLIGREVEEMELKDSNNSKYHFIEISLYRGKKNGLTFMSQALSLALLLIP